MSQDFNYQEALLQCKTMEDITGKDGLVQKIIKDAVEHILGHELEDYISKKTAAGTVSSSDSATAWTMLPYWHFSFRRVSITVRNCVPQSRQR